MDPTAFSDIFFDPETLMKLEADGCELSVTGVSKYLREHSSSFFPVLLTWDMTSRCNFSCPFCYIRDNSITQEVCFEEAAKVIDGMVSEGLFEVFLSGGECLLLKDFLKIYRYFKEKGVFVTVFTNGSLIDDELLRCWKELPPCSVEITLYDNDFSSKPFSSILRLLEMGIHVVPKFTLTHTTLPYYEDVKQWIEEHDLSIAIDADLTDGLDDMHSNIEKKYSLSMKQKKYYIPNKYEYIKNENRRRTGFPCKSKQGIVQILPDFTISLCNKMKIRWDLRKTDIYVAIKELRQLIMEYKDVEIKGCNGCIYSHRCSMCFVNAINKDGELYVPKGFCDSIKAKCLEMESFHSEFNKRV